MRDPDEQILDFARARISVQMAEGGDIPQRPIRLMQPDGGLLPAPQHLFGQGRNPSQTHEPIGLVGPQPTFPLSAGKGPDRQSKDHDELLLADMKT